MRNQLAFSQTLILAFWSASISAGASGATKTPGPADLGWPRQYTDGSAKLMLQQPQVDAWPDFKKLTARFAAALTIAKGAQPIWGVLSIESETTVELEARTVTFGNFRVTGVAFPSARDEGEAKLCEALTFKLLPAYPTTVAIERILAYLDESAVNARQTKVLLEPPPILVSKQPAVLVMIDGEPVLMDVEQTSLQKVVNTNWDLFFDKTTNRYYLRDDRVWLAAKVLTEAWMPVDKMPKDFSRLPATEQYKEVSQTAAKPQKPAIVKLVLVVHKPSELIVLNGEPSNQPIAGTNLLWVSNTECDLFFDQASRQYYFLTSGRWFRASELVSNQWTAATTSLPEDFQKIPPAHPRAHVLAAVAGTRQAEEAVLQASIPHAATVQRKSAKAEAKYVGEPKFKAIPDTGVEYATNTPNDVLRIHGRYYLCIQGVWFASAAAEGPWEAADKIPDEIYSIPSESSKHNVTYVVIQDSTPDTVTYAYTAGYTGVYVGYGVAMWGTGYYYPPYYGYGPYPVYWPSSYYTYGASAWYNPATATYGRGSAVYGPYGGYARGAAYNPATGTYAWGRSAWGPYGSAASGGFYNPNTGGWGGSYHASNGYQSWGQSVVGRGSQSAKTASYADSRGAVGAIETSAGGKAVAARGSQGQGFVGKSSAGDVYAGRDGSVYKRDQASGQWYKNNGGAWQSVNRPSPSGSTGERTGQSQSSRPSAGTQPSPFAGANRDPVQRDLNRDASARSWGNYNAQKSGTSLNSSGWTSGGFTGHQTSGWATRSPGFGRRR